MNENKKEINSNLTSVISRKETKKKTKISQGRRLWLFLVLSILLGGLAGGFFGFLAVNYFKVKPAEDTGKEKNETIFEAKSLVQEDVAVVQVVEEASPAVVSIIVTKDVPMLDSFFYNPFANDPFFNPFGFKQDSPAEPETEKREIGGGTGFIVDPDGYIITNGHVVDDKEAEYTVMMNDGSRVDAQVLARDAYFDIAILKIDQKNLPIVRLGSSDSLKIGQTVIAIGNSLGEFRNTVSKGIVSGLKRNIDAGDGRGQSETLDEVIQTDAAINPGNSGGPLLNLKGEVIGVNVAMAQGAENIGFSIPINEVNKIYKSVKATGKISRPYLGVRYLPITEDIQKENNLSVGYGALVLRGQKLGDLAVIPGSPADKAGLVENDIILEIDGTKIDQENDLAKIIRRKNVGDRLSLKVLSKGKEKTVDVILEEATN